MSAPVNHAPLAAKDQQQITYLTGRFDMCRLLATSPCFNKPQIEIIKEQAYRQQERLEALGVEFTEPVPDGSQA
jgi:hypothetical protein